MPISDSIIEGLRNNVEKYTELNLYQQDLQNEDCHTLAEAMKSNTVLTSLSLGCNEEIGDEGFKPLAKELRSKNQKITSLTMYGCKGIREKGWKYLAGILYVNKTLKDLDFRSNGIGDQGCSILAGPLRVNPILTSLTLCSNAIHDEGCQAIASSLEYNSALQAIYLNYNNIKAKGAKALAKALKINKSLTNLFLDGNEIGNEGCKEFASSLKVNNTLTNLSLRSNAIEHCEGYQALACSLKDNMVLTHLDLLFNPVDHDSFAWKQLQMYLKLNRNGRHEYLSAENSSSITHDKWIEVLIEAQQQYSLDQFLYFLSVKPDLCLRVCSQVSGTNE